MAEWHGYRLGHRANRHAEGEKQARKKTNSQPARTPDQSGQGVYAKVKTDDRNPGLLDDISDQVDRQRKRHQRQRRPPRALGCGQ